MKHYKKLNQYKASNLVYDCDSGSAYSYDWYVIAKRIDGNMVVNKFSYSNTTIKHFYKICRLFDSLGIQYIEIDAPRGLQNLEAAREYYVDRINNLQRDIEKPRTQAKKNAERAELINKLVLELRTITDFQRMGY